MNGEEILKKGKKVKKWIKIAILLVILAIIALFANIGYKTEKVKENPVSFTENYGMNVKEGNYAYMDVELLTSTVATYGSNEDSTNWKNARFYIAFSENYMYLVELNEETYNQLKEIQEFTYTTEETAEHPGNKRIYGVAQKIPAELKPIVIEYYSQYIGNEGTINETNFDEYFGTLLLNVRANPANINTETIILLILIIILIIFISMAHVTLSNTRKTKKYLAKNEYYEHEIEKELEDATTEKFMFNQISLTNNYIVDVINGLTIVKYSDIKWLYVHKLKRYGITVSTQVILKLKDGKSSFNVLEVAGEGNQETETITNKICERLSSDTLIGYTKENIKKFKEYKKELKQNK